MKRFAQIELCQNKPIALACVSMNYAKNEPNLFINNVLSQAALFIELRMFHDFLPFLQCFLPSTSNEI